MSEKQTHTPTPWTIQHRSLQYIIRGEDGVVVAHPSWAATNRKPYPLKAESLANAAFIVRACNSHAALVEAATACLRFAEGELEARGDEDGQYDRPAQPLIEALVAALKLAGES